MTARSKVLLSPLHIHPTSAKNSVKTAVLLHNFVKMNDGSYCPPDYVDQYQGDTKSMVYGTKKLEHHCRDMAE